MNGANASLDLNGLAQALGARDIQILMLEQRVRELEAALAAGAPAAPPDLPLPAPPPPAMEGAPAALARGARRGADNGTG